MFTARVYHGKVARAHLVACAGECGRRGGYVEVVGVPEDVAAEMYKLASINLCSNVNGQICTAMVMNPPKVRLRPTSFRV